MLHSDEIAAIMLEITTGRPSGIAGPEAAELREHISRTIEQKDDSGHFLHVPGEWEV